mgnify:CR=1 FL=1
MRRALVGMGLVVGWVGCAGMGARQLPPTEQLVDSQVTIRQAEEAGASANPTAAQHLEWAREQTQGARRLLELNRKADAALYLQRAEADAQLALALAREAPARAEADRVFQVVQQLQQTAVQ